MLVLLIVILKGLRVYLKEGGRTDKTSAVRVCMPSLPPFLPSVCTHTSSCLVYIARLPLVTLPSTLPFYPYIGQEEKAER